MRTLATKNIKGGTKATHLDRTIGYDPELILRRAMDLLDARDFRQERKKPRMVVEAGQVTVFSVDNRRLNRPRAERTFRQLTRSS